MILEVEILDASAQIQRTTIDLPLLGLLKHLAIAGQGYMPSAKEYIRTIGMFLHYIEYLSPRALLDSHFSEPPSIRRDPTEKGDFSTIAGKGIADFLCRRISGAKVTFNYEAAMTVNGHRIRGQRPDLYCIGVN